MFPQLTHVRYPDLPEELGFFRAEEILDMHPDRPRKTRQTSTLQKHPAVFNYRDWLAPEGRAKIHTGFNGDILAWNYVTKRRHGLTSMGTCVIKETLKK